MYIILHMRIYQLDQKAKMDLKYIEYILHTVVLHIIIDVIRQGLPLFYLVRISPFVVNIPMKETGYYKSLQLLSHVVVKL